MLCDACFRMLRGQEGRQWKGTYDLHFSHHDRGGYEGEQDLRKSAIRSLQESAAMNCGICRVIHDDLQSKLYPDKLSDARPLNIMASLSVLNDPRTRHLYRLDFKLRYDRVRSHRTFILKENTVNDPQFRTPLSHATSSDEVFQLAMQWITNCDCAEEAQTWYPRRLIDLSELKTRDYLDHKRLVSTYRHGDILVKLVEKVGEGEIPHRENMRYVTLSHRWGSSASHQLKLTTENIDTFKDGIRLEKLPKTFQDAVEFASRLPGVGYIWIDSLCIKQGPDEREDWLTESAIMDKIYSKSFLNLSATAGESSDDGLFSYRKPELLLEDEVTLNIDGIPGQYHSPGENGLSSSSSDLRNLQRCTILDVCFWDTHVSEAPVNKRGWVLQERIMAPRVLHFCYDQVAWECGEFDAAESRPQGIPNFQLTHEGLVRESRLKGLDPETDGKELRRIRLKGFDDPDAHLVPHIYALELWRRIVEVYSKTAITNPGDKLIALSGMARRMAAEIGTEKKPAVYIAGLWKNYLESQLLWRIEPVFRELDSSFESPSTRPKDYRAPSFSWASLDVEKANGLIYGEVTDQDLFITVKEVQVPAKSQENPYGIVAKGHLLLRGKLRRARLHKKGKGRFCWYLVGREELDSEEHTNIYLDCPDQDAIFETDDIYCLPAAKGERTDTEESKYIICLLLQLMKSQDQPTFRRIGLTKLSPWADKLARHRILETFPSDVDMPHREYDPETGEHTIYIV